ncbi:Uncharacterized conserved protein YlxW, UPF0749 family [Micrococcales bacterium KH10]|nr:Uncharacterized conserved protein YlxW, UPF0749 family [Micrococcales bacterium KH10]
MADKDDRTPARNSMTLLTEVMNHPLDQGYVEAKSRPHGHRKQRPTAIALRMIVAIFVGLCITAAVLELRSPRPAVTQARTLLGDEIIAKRDLVEALEDQNDYLRYEIEQASNRLLYGDEGQAIKPTSADTLAVGSESVSGPGIVITLNDGNVERDPDAARVQDTDLQLVINELWDAGAEAIAINGHRLGPRSAIRGAGGAVLVDLTAVVSPFEISAIGSTNTLQVALARSQTADHLSRLNATYGITFKVVGETSLTLASEPVANLQVAGVPVGESSVGSVPEEMPQGVR